MVKVVVKLKPVVAIDGYTASAVIDVTNVVTILILILVALMMMMIREMLLWMMVMVGMMMIVIVRPLSHLEL